MHTALGAHLVACGGMSLALASAPAEEEQDTAGLFLFAGVSTVAGLIALADQANGVFMGWAFCGVLLAQSAAVISSTLGSEQPWKCLYRGSRCDA